MLLAKEDTVDNTRILINVAIIISIMLLLCYTIPYVYDVVTDNTEGEQITTKENWDIVEEVHSIRERQKHNIGNMSQISSYGI